MTTGKDTNDSGTPTNDDAAWERFAAEHGDELKDMENSRSARKFERHARKAEKQALLSVNDLRADAFATRPAPGPRDFTGPSLLDAADDHFTPPEPDLGGMRRSTMVLWAMLLLGVAGVIGSLFVPVLGGLVAGVGGVLLLVGAAGLVSRLRGHSETRRDMFDDGSRV